MAEGRIDVIVLNGAPSSGKTSIAIWLQDRLEGSWVALGIDVLIAMLPARLGSGSGGVGIGPDGGLTLGPSIGGSRPRGWPGWPPWPGRAPR